MIIKSDNKAIENAVKTLESILVKNGACFHPKLATISENGYLSVQIDGPLNPGEKIMDIPQRLLIPATEMNFSIKGNDFAVDPDMDLVSAQQADIGKATLEIYNLTNKVDMHKKENPYLAYKDHPELLNILAPTRSENAVADGKYDFLNDRPNALSEDEFIVKSYLLSRVLGHTKGDTDEKTQSIMPIIDFMNHHHQGAPFALSQIPNQEKTMKINNQQPLVESRECFVLYGGYDTVDLFLNYGFADPYAPFIRSIPLTINIQGHPPIEILSIPGVRRKNKPPKQLQDLSFYVPSISKQEDGTARVTHLIIPSKVAPHALRRILQILIRTHVGQKATKEFLIDTIFEAEDLIIRKNIEFYEDMLVKLEKIDAPEDKKSNIRQIAELQLTKLYRYAYAPSFFSGTPPTLGSNTNSQDGEADEVLEDGEEFDIESSASAE